MNTSFDITTDLFLGGKLKIQQYKKGFRSGSDAVFLAAFIPETSGRILEIGCGAGVASLCLGIRLSKAHITGIDVEENLIQLAIQNAKNNSLETQCRFSVQDIQNLDFPKQTFDHVFSNPPYFDQSSPSPFPQKALARNQIVPPVKWIKECIKMAKPRGRVSFIYPTHSLHHLLQALEGLGDIQLFPLWPSKDKDSKRILVSARKGVKGGLHLHRGLILHNDQGLYTAEADNVLRLGTSLF
jgi:tRNA1Val (adenine37-N6)-methyltransferase